MIDAVIRTLDAIIRGLEMAINAIYRGFDFIINTIDRVSRRVAGLLLSGARLLFYICPFVSMVLIGSWERMDWLFWTGTIFLSLCIALFVRELLSEFKGVPSKGAELDKPQRYRVFVVVMFLNILAVGYFLFKNQTAIRSMLRGLGMQV